MKIKKIIIFMIISLFALIIKSNAAEKVDIDLSKISSAINNSKYVSSLKDLDVIIDAKYDKETNNITLKYDDLFLVYSYDSDTTTYSTTYSIYDTDAYNKYNILSSLFIDCISTLQGNPEGAQIPFTLDDSFCYSNLKSDGIAKNFVTENGGTVAKIEVNPFIKLPILSTSLPIDKNHFLLESTGMHTDVDCLVKFQDLVFYKTINENNEMELYIGNLNELNDYAYSSILTAVSILFDDERASYYISDNYKNFSDGNYEFDGISITTDVSELPVKNVDTVIIPNNMKYAKFVINRDTVKSHLDNVEIPDSPQVGDSSGNKIPIALILCIGATFFITGIAIKEKMKSKE